MIHHPGTGVNEVVGMLQGQRREAKALEQAVSELLCEGGADVVEARLAVFPYWMGYQSMVK